MHRLFLPMQQNSLKTMQLLCSDGIEQLFLMGGEMLEFVYR